MEEAPRRQAVDGGIPWAHDNGQLWTDGALNRNLQQARGVRCTPSKQSSARPSWMGLRTWFSMALYQDPHVWKVIPRSVPSQSSDCVRGKVRYGCQYVLNTSLALHNFPFSHTGRVGGFFTDSGKDEIQVGFDDTVGSSMYLLLYLLSVWYRIIGFLCTGGHKVSVSDYFI